MEVDRPALSGSFVVDASVVCSWILPDEDSPVASAALDRLVLNDAIAPDILWHEVRNVLMMARRRKRIHFDAVLEGLAVLRRLSIVTPPPLSDHLVLDLAERHGLTAYDAAYLALALDARLPLATSDKRLRVAAEAEDVMLLA